MDAPARVVELVKRFRDNPKYFRVPDFNEERTKNEFINPLFECLGWDVYNAKGLIKPYQDVVYEQQVKVGGRTKAPDYGFYTGGKCQFFLEAKKPSVGIKEDKEPAFQLRRYSWSAQHPVGVLTDFEELAIYDCRIAPDKDDKASVARTLYLGYEDYVEQWDEIYRLFSREAVLEGSLEKYAKTNRKRQGTQTVDAAFLREIEGWRSALARDLAARNDLNTRQLNYAVQMTIDRLIFLRMAEDRGIEDYGKLLGLTNGTGVYGRLVQQFRDADDRYNSGLFHFRNERGRGGEPDDLTPNLKIDDDVLGGIVRGLYYPESPYEFSVLPIDVLGQVYEKFLGSVIHLEDGHTATVEQKPEVRKAGGVYYTPTYIVDYIVENTIGKLLEGKKPGPRGGASRLKIVDPACGSGSFLIGAYEYLLDWHRDRYLEDGPQKWGKQIYEGRGGQWHLTIDEKKRILLNNIYGVDIDPQAVEVTKLSLLIKVLEGETSETVDSQLRMFQERALPDLRENIKCGNSLIGPDFYESEQMILLDEEEHYRINVFDWQKAFPQIFEGDDAGFDAVIGNPPYIFTRNRGIDELQKTYFYSHYKHQSSQLNTFGIFVERCYALLCESGILGFITPNNWLTIQSFILLRKFVLGSATNVKIVNILDRVFTAADVDTAIVIMGKSTSANLTIAEIVNKEETFSKDIELPDIKPPAYIIQISLLKDFKGRQLLEQIESRSQPLSTVCTVSTGLKAYQKGKGKPPQTKYEKENRVFHTDAKSDSTSSPYLQGVDVRRYLLAWSGEYLSYGDWLAEPRKSVPFTGERLLVRQIPSLPPYLVHGIFTDNHFYNDINSMVVFAPIEDISLKYLLGLLNSRLLSVWFLKTFDKLQRKIFPQFKVKELAMFPIRILDFSDPEDVARHEEMVRLVEQMLTSQEKLAEAKLEQERTVIGYQISATDKQIDNLVYELYGLSEEEIRLVEKSA